MHTLVDREHLGVASTVAIHCVAILSAAAEGAILGKEFLNYDHLPCRRSDTTRVGAAQPLWVEDLCEHALKRSKQGRCFDPLLPRHLPRPGAHGRLQHLDILTYFAELCHPYKQIFVQTQ